MSSPRTAGTMRARGMTAARKFPSAACSLRLQGNRHETHAVRPELEKSGKVGGKVPGVFDGEQYSLADTSV